MGLEYGKKKERIPIKRNQREKKIKKEKEAETDREVQ